VPVQDPRFRHVPAHAHIPAIPHVSNNPLRMNSSDGSGLSDAEEDLDDDGLTNLEEQAYCTDSLVHENRQRQHP
jgi:hypothetical protein